MLSKERMRTHGQNVIQNYKEDSNNNIEQRDSRDSRERERERDKENDFKELLTNKNNRAIKYEVKPSTVNSTQSYSNQYNQN